MDLRGVVLAGGTGSRLMPLTKVTNKHLLGVGQKPMIYYPIEKLTSIGIEEILIVTGVEHMGDVVDPQRFGVAELSDGKVIGIEEKPKEPKSDYAVTGIYFYDALVFDIIRMLKPSARGELEITHVNDAYIAKGRLAYDILDGWWTDAGTFESLNRANELVIKEPPQ